MQLCVAECFVSLVEDDSEEWGDDDDAVFQPTHTTDL